MRINKSDHKIDLIAVGIGVICSMMISLIFQFNGPFLDLENKTADYRFKLRGSLPVDDRIILIDIDDQSIAEIGRWPWHRSYHARMIEVLSKSGAAAIGYDILFNQPAGAEEDSALITATQEAGNVYFPLAFELEKDTPLLAVKREIGPFEELRMAAAGLGHISSNRDPDGTIRKVPLVVNAGGHHYPAFSLAVIAGYLKVPKDRILIDPKEGLILQDALIPNQNTRKHREIPIDMQGMMRINYAGRWAETFAHFSFVDILDAWEKGDKQDLFDILHGKVCLVSNTATGYDLKPTPFEPDYPGGGIHANAINTILTGQYLKDFGALPLLGTAMVLSVMAVILTIRSRWWIGLLSSVIIGLIYLLLTIYAFHKGLVVQFFPVVLTIGLAHISGLLYQNRLSWSHVEKLTEEKQRIGQSLQQISKALSNNEGELNRSREELSRLLRELDNMKGQEKERLEQIRYLETILERATAEQQELLNKKQELEEKVGDLLIATVHEAVPMGEEFETLQKECAHHGIITHNKQMLQVFAKAKRIALSKDMSVVLIQGETGTGKELFARAVWAMSTRSKNPFITVNIPALQDNLIESELFGHLKGSFTGAVSDKKGKFQSADRGTIFLDEIGEMKLDLQPKLLRVLQSKEVDPIGASSPVRVDVQIIAATNRDLWAEVKCGKFREDLYYRLNAFPITLPPLRERREDIEMLTEYFVRKYTLGSERRINGLSVNAMKRLKEHSWPGNIRELENTICRGITMAKGDWITEANLELADNLVEDHLEMIVEGEPLSDKDFLTLLRENEFEIGKTAQRLNISRGTVGSRFKGICFKLLAENNGDLILTAKAIGGEGKTADLVEQRIQEYYDNLKQVIHHYNSYDEAIEGCHRRFKNLPQKYFVSLEILARKYFDQKEKKL